MKIKTTVMGLILASGFGSAPAGATTGDDFVIDSVKDLTRLCETPSSDPAYVAALQFCYGYMQGAYDYYLAERKGPDAKLFVCLPNPGPSRDEVARLFTPWVKAHPEYDLEPAVEVLFRFGAEKWPCKEKKTPQKPEPKF